MEKLAVLKKATFFSNTVIQQHGVRVCLVRKPPDARGPRLFGFGVHKFNQRSAYTVTSGTRINKKVLQVHIVANSPAASVLDVMHLT